MTLPECACRIALPHLGELLFCAHPRVHFRNGLVVNMACRECEYRTESAVEGMRSVPRHLNPADGVTPCCFLKKSQADRLQCLHPSGHSASDVYCLACIDYRSRPARGSVRNWAIGMTTAKRRVPTLSRSLDSLSQAGWDSREVHLFSEPDALPAGSTFNGPVTIRGRKAGAFPNWYLALQELVLTQPAADGYLLLQDDVVFCRGLREYLEDELWPDSAAGFVSLYCGKLQSNPDQQQGWVQLHPHGDLFGALAVAFSAGAARAILLHPMLQRHRESGSGTYGIDFVLARWATESQMPSYFHVPSLVDHIGVTSAIFSSARDGPERQVASFIGEQTDVRTVMNQPQKTREELSLSNFAESEV